MYNSQYYTCEQVDQRLLQGYLDDYNSENNTSLTKSQFLSLLAAHLNNGLTTSNIVQESGNNTNKLMSQAIVTQLLSNLQSNINARDGYYQATINGGSITVNAPNYLLGTGGNLRIKMPSVGTTASTLTIGNANDVQLWYNGAAVSAQNTWETDEIISVFYDGTRFMASNSQGGGGKAEKIKYDNSQSGIASDNVQGALDKIGEELTELEGELTEETTVGNNVEIDLTEYTAVRAFPNPDIWLVTNSQYPYYGIFVPIEAGQRYIFTSNSEYLSYYGFLTTNSYRHNANVSYATGCTRVSVPAGETVIDTAPSDAKYIWIATYTLQDCTPELFAEYHKMSVKDYLNNTDATPTKDSVNLVTSGGVYGAVQELQESLLIEGDDDLMNVSNQSIVKNVTSNYTVTKQSGGFKIQRAKSSTTSTGYAGITLPSLTVGTSYRISFEYTTTFSSVYISIRDSSGSNILALKNSSTELSGTVSVDIVYSSDMYSLTAVAIPGTDTSDYLLVSNITIRELFIVTERCIENTNEINSKSEEIATNTAGIQRLEDAVYYESGMSYMTYTGNKIAYPANRIGYKKISTFDSLQGAAIYGDIAFTMSSASVDIFNLRTRTTIATSSSISGLPGKVVNWHDNSAQFSNIFYDVNDDFPLMYIGGTLNDNVGDVAVCRVVASSNKTYALQAVQIIHTGWGYCDVAFDAEKGELVLHKEGKSFRRYTAPAIFENDVVVSEYTLTENDLVQQFVLDTNITTPQDATVHRGLMYMTFGHQVDAKLRVVDLYNGMLVNDIDLSGYLDSAPEGNGFYNEHMILFCGEGTYKLWFM